MQMHKLLGNIFSCYRRWPITKVNSGSTARHTQSETRIMISSRSCYDCEGRALVATSYGEFHNILDEDTNAYIAKEMHMAWGLSYLNDEVSYIRVEAWRIPLKVLSHPFARPKGQIKSTCSHDILPWAGSWGYGEGPHSVCSWDWRMDGSFWEMVKTMARSSVHTRVCKYIQAHSYKRPPSVPRYLSGSRQPFWVSCPVYVWDRHWKGYPL